MANPRDAEIACGDEKKGARRLDGPVVHHRADLRVALLDDVLRVLLAEEAAQIAPQLPL